MLLARVLGMELRRVRHRSEHDDHCFRVAQLATGHGEQYLAEFHTVDKARTSRIVGFCFVVSIVTAVLGFACTLASAGWIAAHGLDKPQLVSSWRVASGAMFFSVLNGFQLGALAGLEAPGDREGLAIGAVGNAVACLVGARYAGRTRLDVS